MLVDSEMNDPTTSLLLICAATTFAAALVVAQRRLVAGVARRFLRLPRFEQALLVVAVCVMTVCAQKSGTNEVSGAAGDIFNAEVGETQRLGDAEVRPERRSGVSPLLLRTLSSSPRLCVSPTSTLETPFVPLFWAQTAITQTATTSSTCSTRDKFTNRRAILSTVLPCATANAAAKVVAAQISRRLSISVFICAVLYQRIPKHAVPDPARRQGEGAP